MDTQQTYIKLWEQVYIPLSDELDITDPAIAQSLYDGAEHALRLGFDKAHPGHELVSVKAVRIEEKHKQTDRDFLEDTGPTRIIVVRLEYVMTDPDGVYAPTP